MQPECIFPLGTWNFRNFKPDSLLNVKGPECQAVRNRFSGKNSGTYEEEFEAFQSPVVRTPIIANPRLYFNPSFVFFLSKALSRKILSILFRVSYHQIVGKEN